MPVKRILLVDDEKDLLKAMKIRLTVWGYDVSTADSGREAVEFVKREAPDVLILDVKMPEMNGIETLRRVREFNKELPVLMLSAYSDEERIDKIVELGVFGFIKKGGEFESAAEMVHLALKGQKL